MWCLCTCDIQSAALLLYKRSYIDHHVCFGLRTTDQNAAGIRHIQGLGNVFDVTLDELTHASMTDAGSTAEIGGLDELVIQSAEVRVV